MLMISFRQMDNNNTKSINEKHPMFNEKQAQVKLRVSSNVNEGQNENKQFFLIIQKEGIFITMAI